MSLVEFTGYDYRVPGLAGHVHRVPAEVAVTYTGSLVEVEVTYIRSLVEVEVTYIESRVVELIRVISYYHHGTGAGGSCGTRF